MSVINNVLKKYSKKGDTKRVSVSIKLKQNLNEDLEYLSKYLGISKSKLIEDIIEASGLSKKVNELKNQNNITDNNINTTAINSDLNISSETRNIR
jgi:metal-responsive CopG/Arc/MetJ family transcriptional regulator